MPGVMQPGVSQAGCDQQVFPLVVVGSRVERATGLGREQPPAVLPEVAGVRALLVLPLLVPPQDLDQLIGQADRPGARAGLRLLGVRSDLHLVPAEAGLPTTRLRAPVPVLRA